MKHQYNLRVEHLSIEEISEIDKKFAEAGWLIKGYNRTLEPHTLRVYQWEQIEFEPVYPSGYEQQMAPIELNLRAFHVDD